jgi:PIN domain nuclease of toxin-antitoxin system
MADFLLDASVFRAYLGGDLSARRVVDRVLDGSETAAVSSATVFELWRDPALDRRTEMALTALVGFVEVAPLSAEAAKRAGLLLARATRTAANRSAITPWSRRSHWSGRSRFAPSRPTGTRTSASSWSPVDPFHMRPRSIAF